MCTVEVGDLVEIIETSYNHNTETPIGRVGKVTEVPGMVKDVAPEFLEEFGMSDEACAIYVQLGLRGPTVALVDEEVELLHRIQVSA